jgi:hypothetical protein
MQSTVAWDARLATAEHWALECTLARQLTLASLPARAAALHTVALPRRATQLSISAVLFQTDSATQETALASVAMQWANASLLRRAAAWQSAALKPAAVQFTTAKLPLVPNALQSVLLSPSASHFTIAEDPFRAFAMQSTTDMPTATQSTKPLLFFLATLMHSALL